MPSSDERLAAIDARLAAVDGKLDRAIIHFETAQQTVEGFDDRIAMLQKTADNLSAASRSLANTSLQLHAERRLGFWAAIVVASILGGAIASVAHDAFAVVTTKPALHSGDPK